MAFFQGWCYNVPVIGMKFISYQLTDDLNQH